MRVILTVVLLYVSLPAFAQMQGWWNAVNANQTAPASGGAAWTPASLTGLYAWWKADAGVYSDLGTTPAANGNTVAQWNNQATAGGATLNLRSPAGQPTYYTGVINGNPALWFNGTSAYMTNHTFSAALPSTYFIIAAMTNVTSGQHAYAGNVGGNNWTFRQYGPNGDIDLYSGTDLDIGNQGDANTNYWTVVWNGASTLVRKRGVQVGSGNSGNTINPVNGDFIMGAEPGFDQNFSGYIMEMFIVTNIAVTGSDLTSAENYMKTRAGL